MFRLLLSSELHHIGNRRRGPTPAQSYPWHHRLKRAGTNRGRSSGKKFCFDCPLHIFPMTYFSCEHCQLVSHVTNHAPSSPRTKPVNGLDTANQSGIASRNWNGARLRRCQRASVVGRTVERPEES